LEKKGNYDNKKTSSTYKTAICHYQMLILNLQLTLPSSGSLSFFFK